jgi:endoglucanase
MIFFRASQFHSFLFLTLLLASPSLAAMRVDNFAGNGLEGHWVSFVDSSSHISPNPFILSGGGHSSDQCARLDFELKQGAQFPYAGMTDSFTPQNLSEYEGVRFWAKGQGIWNCMLPIPATAAEYNHYSSPISPGPDWKLYEIPFSKLKQPWGTPKPWDPSAVTGIQFSAGTTAGDKGFIYVDEIEFYKKGEEQTKNVVNNPILKEPKVNQEGYLPDSEKYFVISQSDKIGKGDSFQILDQTGKTAFSGTITTDSMDDTTFTGEKVFRVDFSGLSLPGRYTVSIDAIKSLPFVIKTDLFDSLFKDSLRCFYLIRCGTAINDPVTGLKHDACHMKDAPFQSDLSKNGDFTGGWHNAGDYGKWTHMEAISCAWMMWLYELKTKDMAGLQNHIPESGNGISDLLNEAKWGLTWLLKMQAADGGVYHKVDSEDHFCFGTGPDKDPASRFLQGEGCIDAGVFTGVMCQATRVFWKIDPPFAKKCWAAANRSWTWLGQHPDARFKDPDYGDDDPSQEELWALGEMARMSRDKSLETRFEQESATTRLQSLSWMTPQFFGYMSMAFSPKTSVTEKQTIIQALTQICDDLVQKTDTNGYGVCLTPNDYYWGSNENILDKTGALLFAYHLTGEAKYRQAALREMNYILGLNSLETSFVTGHGERAESHPHHWDYASYQIVMPGWAGGGANQYPTGADPALLGLINSNTPPAKCFFDGPGTTSWASNEGQTVENAALVFDAGYLASF